MKENSAVPSVVSVHDTERVVFLDTSLMKSPFEYTPLPTAGVTEGVYEALHLLRVGPGIGFGEMIALAARNWRCLSVPCAHQLSVGIGACLSYICHGTDGNASPFSELIRALRVVVVSQNMFPDNPLHVGVLLFADLPSGTFPAAFLNGAVVIGIQENNVEGTSMMRGVIEYVRVHFGSFAVVTEIFIETVVKHS